MMMAAGMAEATAHSSGSIIKSSCRLIWVATLAAGAKSNTRGPHVGAHVLLDSQAHMLVNFSPYPGKI